MASAVNLLTFLCALGLWRFAEGPKEYAVYFGSVIFVLTPIAFLIALFGAAMIFRYRTLRWPWFVFMLGLTPLPLAMAVLLIRLLLRSFTSE